MKTFFLGFTLSAALTFGVVWAANDYRLQHAERDVRGYFYQAADTVAFGGGAQDPSADVGENQ